MKINLLFLNQKSHLFYQNLIQYQLFLINSQLKLKFIKINKHKEIEFHQMQNLFIKDENKFTIDLDNFYLLQNQNMNINESINKDYKQIELLKVNFNSLKFDGDYFLQNLYELSSKCTSLISLSICLDSTLINDLSLVSIQKLLSNSLKIKCLQLNLSQNLITKEGAYILAKGIRGNLNLQSISLNFEQATNYFYFYFKIFQQKLDLQLRTKKFIKLFKGTQIFNLTRAQLGVSFYFNFFLKLQKYIRKNQIESDAAIEFGKLLEQTQQLESLVLNFNNNKIKTEGAFQICKGISKCSKIKDLVLMFNNIYLIYDQQKYGLQPLGIQISKCRHLKKLVLDLGQNSNSSYNELLPILTNCTNLRHLQFDFNSKTTEFQLKSELNQFYFVIERANYITYLSLKIENYTFGTQGGQLLVNELLKCKNLITLQLSLIETNISIADFESLILESRRRLNLSQFYCIVQQSWLTQLQLKKSKYQYLFKKSAKMVQYSLVFTKSF
ncbi:kinase domain protein, putative (macronuclear) [Tetrahymena thermophila SB210]|uniref:Kinase domain protein, putative n=1 Tax=Tetrahymena thermophila (strain SB210) TaxID=312017 RepID=W7WZJ8_TETTS|nr:kinase domain protein, putative [Tetrahymena thermophila SB210]EWS72285.1 kinase domain protein, putative [Tetrahymena thermophila SB210]|eukprot:XP_012655225.1 kinase domain protein, putative [Tetrahymena thermophila SB210]